MSNAQIKNKMNNNDFRKRIHELIPGGAHTYSKGDDQFPENAPAGIVRGKGAHVFDLEGRKYLDCSMGLTSVSLGHAYKPVIDRIKAELDNGVNFQRPSFLELEMAETFLSIVPQHDMVKFAKNGSTVTTAAVKLARAKTGRKLVAFPGNHPFYSYDDWFIGTTPCSKGVPEEFSQLSITFDGCNIDSLRELFRKYPNQIACVITEPEKNTCSNCTCNKSPEAFLKEAIELTQSEGALFIVDEMVTGFKTAFPGSISKYNLNPDMATWGKGIANGFSFCALTGKKEVMELGGIQNKGEEKVFLISSTHGAETHTLAAAIETIKIFKSNNVVKKNHELGQYLIDKCKDLISQHQLDSYIQLIDCNWMPTFLFSDASRNLSVGFKTLAMQEMIARGVLFQGVFIPCFEHTIADIDFFANCFEQTLQVYKHALKEGFEKFLVGEPIKPVFRKLL
jgi:glutamate-1-semialdehyde aminotransferase